MITLTLSDPAFLAGSQEVGFPNPADPDIWAWWSTDKYLDTTTDPGKLYVLGDRSSNTADKANRTNSRNLVPWAAGKEPRVSGSGNTGNLLEVSNTINSSRWTELSATKDDDTHITFTAPNGYVRTAASILTTTSRTYTYRVKLRAVSGNTNIRLYHTGSPTGNFTAITIDGTLTEYSTTFLGTSTGNILVGVQDPNAMGHGQIEITEPQVRDSTWDTDYVETSGYPILAGYAGQRYMLMGTTSDLGAITPVTGSGFSHPFTVYLLYRPRFWTTPGRVLASRSPMYGALITQADAGTEVKIYTSPPASSTKVTGPANDAWGVITAVFNGASSEVRLNKGVAVAGSLTDVALTNGFAFGLDTVDGFQSNIDLIEAMVRTTADSTATQDLYIQYLADKIGLAV